MDTDMAEHQKYFEEFLEVCKTHLKGDFQILGLIRNRYSETNLTFLATNEFRDHTQIIGAKIESNPAKIFVYIKEFIDELKCYKRSHERKKKRKRSKDGDSDHKQKKSRTLLSETIHLNCHDKESENCSSDNESRNSSVQMITTVADVHPLTPVSTSSKVDALQCSPIHSESFSFEKNNCSIHVEDEVIDVDAESNKQPYSRLRLRRIKPLQQFDTDFVGPSGDESERDSDYKPVANGHIRRISPVPVSTKPRTSPVPSAFTNGTNSGNENEYETLMELENAEKESPKQEKKDRKRGSERQIQRLEKLLHDLDREIKRLTEKELSLEDMNEEDSYYLREDKLKARFNKVFAKLCELKGREMSTGRVTERKFCFEGTRYPEINRGIRKFVNRKHSFPDYQDVRAIILRANRRHKLGFKKAAVDSLCREAFTDVGNQLQQRRHKDFIADFGCHLTEDIRVKEKMDPAMFDRDLKRRLEDNKIRGRTKMEEVMEKYSQKQFDLQTSGKVDTSEDDDDDDDDDDDEEVKEADKEGDKVIEAVMIVKQKQDQKPKKVEKSNADSDDDEIPAKTNDGGQKKTLEVIISDDETDDDDDSDVRSIYSSSSAMVVEEDEEEDRQEVENYTNEPESIFKIVNCESLVDTEESRQGIDEDNSWEAQVNDSGETGSFHETNEDSQGFEIVSENYKDSRTCIPWQNVKKSPTPIIDLCDQSEQLIDSESDSSDLPEGLSFSECPSPKCSPSTEARTTEKPCSITELLPNVNEFAIISTPQKRLSPTKLKMKFSPSFISRTIGAIEKANTAHDELLPTIDSDSDEDSLQDYLKSSSTCKKSKTAEVIVLDSD